MCIRLFGTVTFLSYAIIILCLFYFSIRRVGAGSSSSSTLSPVVIMFDDEGFVLCELSCGWWEHDKWFPNGNLDKKGISRKHTRESTQLLKRVCNMRSSSVFNGFSFSSQSSLSSPTNNKAGHNAVKVRQRQISLSQPLAFKAGFKT